MSKLTATQIVKRFMDQRSLSEPLLMSDLALFVWEEFEECPSRSILRNSWELIRLLTNQSRPNQRIGPPILPYSH